MLAGIAVGLMSFLMVLLGGWLAYRDEFLTVGQMQRRGYREGLPFIAHGGMWGDVIILSPLLGLMVALYGREWETWQVLFSSLMGVLISALMHWTYTLGELPEAHVREGKLTQAGCVHFVYMALALSILVLFYLCTPNPATGFIVAADILLIIHVAAGTHLVLGFVHPAWYPDRPHRNPQTWIVVIGVAFILTALTFWLINSQ